MNDQIQKIENGLFSDKTAKDISTFLSDNAGKDDISEDIAKENRFDFLYHLSFIRTNVLGDIRFYNKKNVLVVGESAGIITKFISKKDADGRITALAVTESFSDTAKLYCTGLNNVTIKNGDFDIAIEEENEKYDLIVFAGTFAYVPYCISSSTQEPYSYFLKLCANHLSRNGEIIIAAQNRLGLRYFAGYRETYSGRYYKGIEGYDTADKIRSFSKKEWERLLTESGFAGFTFAYPYPDEVFTTQIFTDEKMPSSDETIPDFQNYASSRMVLFNEQKVLNSLLQEKLFPECSDAFRIIAFRKGGRASGLSRNIYTKFSNERSRRFSVQTEIAHETFGKNRIEKKAAFPEGEEHIQNIFRISHSLNSFYKPAGVQANKCHLISDTDISLEYVDGVPLDKLIDKILTDQGPEAAERELERYIGYMISDRPHIPFAVTDSFWDIFGTNDPSLDGKNSLPISDIDMILSNMIIGNGGKKNLIDYEWTFEFPIPEDYLKFRILNYYVERNPERAILKTRGIYEHFGIDSRSMLVFREMEHNFQMYTEGGHIAVHSMYAHMTPGNYYVQDWKNSLSVSPEQEYLQIFYSADGAFSESDSIRFPINQIRMQQTFKVPPATKVLRIDPGEMPCLCRVDALRPLSENADENKFMIRSNGRIKLNGLYFFEEHDPQIYVEAENPFPETWMISIEIHAGMTSELLHSLAEA